MGCKITNPQNGLEFLHESVAVTKVFVETFCQTPTLKFKASAHVSIFFLFNTTYISLTMIYLKKINSLGFREFVSQYEVDICKEETICQMKLFY